MAVTQYIGARYVPKFFENSDGTEEWRAGVEYEPLTIVTYNSNSYTSKKPVPSNIGNPSDNPSYWVSTGVYNAQVEQLRQDVLQYKEDAEQAIDDTNERIDNLGQRKVIFITDSYADQNRGGFARGIFTTFCQYAGLTPGTDAFVYAKGGAGFAGAGQGMTFGNLLSTAISEHRREDITDVIVAGGANDQEQTAAAINTAKDAFTAAVRTAWPDALITIAMCSGFINVLARKRLMRTVRNVYYNLLPNDKIKCVTNAHIPMMIYSAFTDSVHPNSSGCTNIGRLLADAFRTGNSYGEVPNYVNHYANVPKTNSGGNQALYACYDLTKNGFEFWIRRNTLDLQESITIAHNTGATIALGQLTLATASDMLVPNAESLDDDEPLFHIPVVVMAYTGDTNFTWIPLYGELMGTADANNVVTWYFRAKTAVKSGTAAQCRYTPFTAHIF